MKLFLTSIGLSTPKIVKAFKEELPKKHISASNVLIIALAPDHERLVYLMKSEKQLKSIGLINIKVVNMKDKVDTGKLGDFDVIYVCGGNTFTILDKMRESGLDKYISKQVKKSTVYVGVSAGSIIAGSSIKIAGWGSEGDVNEIGLKKLVGLKLTDIAVFPHYHIELKKEVADFKKLVLYKVVSLTDEQALMIKDNKAILL